MKPVLARRHADGLDTTGLSRALPQIQSLIDVSRQHVVSTANLIRVWLYWNVGRVITEEIQRHPGRADYSEQLLQRLAGTGGAKLNSECRQRMQFGPVLSKADFPM